MYLNVFEYIWMYLNVFECIQMYSNILEYTLQAIHIYWCIHWLKFRPGFEICWRYVEEEKEEEEEKDEEDREKGEEHES